jgi:molecular chaperone GrpE
MNKNSKKKPTHNDVENDSVIQQQTEENTSGQIEDSNEIIVLKDKIIALEKELDDSKKKEEDVYARLLRLSAEFDNYKKRTTREKEALYIDATVDTLKEILPIVDNFERALSVKNCDDVAVLKKGLDMVYRQFIETLTQIGVETIDAVGNEFDPNLHNAVIHVEDENYGSNEVVEELQKGYKIKDKIIRHSYVKVAN